MGKVLLSGTGEMGVLKMGKNKEILKEEGSILRLLPKGIGPTWLGEWEEKGYYFLFMEYIEGTSLEKYVEEKGGILPLREAVELMENLIGEVEKLHRMEESILYRDLKPSNIICLPEGGVRLVDFGGALVQNGKSKWKVGSPLFAAPEQLIEGGRESKATDVYGLGAVFYYCLTGQVLGEGEISIKPGVVWKRILEKSMEWDPALRYPQTSYMLQDIKAAFYEGKRAVELFGRNPGKRKIRWEKNIHIRPYLS